MNKYLSFIGVALLSSHTAANATIINTVIDSSDAIWSGLICSYSKPYAAQGLLVFFVIFK